MKTLSTLSKVLKIAAFLVLALAGVTSAKAQFAYPAAYAYPAQQAPQMPRQAAASSYYLSFDGRYATAPATLPPQVQYAVAAGNYIQSKPYVRGGGHGRVEDFAYDCSSSVSYALIKGGMLKRPLSSNEFANYGEAGPGRFITIYVKPGEHVFMSICGLRLDTSGGSAGEGPRWRANARSMNGFVMRHPFGL